MQAEIISIGSELTTGASLDTNSQWLSRELAALGIHTQLHSTVADDVARMLEVFCAAVERSDLILVTGGLGPTLDDLTRDILAQTAGVNLETNQAQLKRLEDLFAARKREMPARNRIQAEFPVGSLPIVNNNGTAPGIDFTIGRKQGKGTARVFAMPGVPSEMKPMFFESVAPHISGTQHVIRRAEIHCFGAGESRIEELLGDLTSRGRDPEIGITAKQATITMRIFATGKTADECEEKIARADEQICEKLGSLVFGRGQDQLQNALLRLLAEKQQTLATAEFATGGMVSRLLGEIPREDNQSAREFFGGLVLNENIGAHFLSQEDLTATALAERTRQLFGSDMAIAVGPIQDVENVQRVAIGLAAADTQIERSISLTANPAIRDSLVSKGALNLARLFLLDELPAE